MNGRHFNINWSPQPPSYLHCVLKTRCDAPCSVKNKIDGMRHDIQRLSQSCMIDKTCMCCGKSDWEGNWNLPVVLCLLKRWLSSESHFPQNRLPQFIIHLIREWLFPELQKNQKQSQLPPCCITVSAIDLAKSVMCLLLKLDSKSLSQLLFFFLQLHTLVIM